MTRPASWMNSRIQHMAVSWMRSSEKGTGRFQKGQLKELDSSFPPQVQDGTGNAGASLPLFLHVPYLLKVYLYNRLGRSDNPETSLSKQPPFSPLPPLPLSVMQLCISSQQEVQFIFLPLHLDWPCYSGQEFMMAVAV